MINNSVLYNATRHTLFCIPIIVIIAAIGFNYILTIPNLKNILPCLFSLLLFGIIIDDMKLNPYQYTYYNEISRHFITDKNSETDYWGFSLRETYKNIDKIKYPSQYYYVAGGLMPDILAPYMRDRDVCNSYDKNNTLLHNTNINVIGLLGSNDIDNYINQDKCHLVAKTTRGLLFTQTELTMSKAYN
jgi:hypothetical protein